MKNKKELSSIFKAIAPAINQYNKQKVKNIYNSYIKWKIKFNNEVNSYKESTPQIFKTASSTFNNDNDNYNDNNLICLPINTTTNKNKNNNDNKKINNIDDELPSWLIAGRERQLKDSQSKVFERPNHTNCPCCE